MHREAFFASLRRKRHFGCASGVKRNPLSRRIKGIFQFSILIIAILALSKVFCILPLTSPGA